MLDGDNRIRIIIAGLVLAAIAIGYMIFTQKFSLNSSNKQVQQITPNQDLNVTPKGDTLEGFAATSDTTKGGLSEKNISTLPKTAFPTGLVVIFSASAAIAGWSLRKFPH